MSEVLLICPDAFEIEIHPIFDETEKLLLSLAKQRDLVGLARGALVPPSELLSIAAYLNQDGISVSILDLTLEALKGNTKEVVHKKLKKEKPSIVGVRASEICFIDQYYNISSLVRKYNPNILLVAGGVAATGYKDEFLKNSIYDVVVRGEGELTFLELCKNFLNRKKISEIRGISYKDDNKYINNPDREFIDLNTLLLPARHIYPIKDMYELNGSIDLVYSSRGCPHNCSFCNSPSFWKRKWRGRRPEDVVNELKLIDEQGAKIAHIHDLNFGVNKKWVKELCNLIKKSDIDILWDCQFTVRDLKNETLKTLYEGNCRGVFIGIESASQASLDGSNKSYSATTLLKALNNAKNQGIHIDGGYVVGLPDDDIKSLEETKQLAVSLLKKDLVETPIYFLFCPWKGSYVGDNPLKAGIKIENTDLRFWHGFSSKPIASTKHVNAKNVYDYWESGWYKIRDILEKKVNDQ